MLNIWLDKNALNGDLTIYSITKWKERSEEYLNNAELVITTEGHLHFLINFASDSPVLEEFEELLESFGYYYELGYSWCLGIYKIDDDATPISQNNLNYSEKLKDERWLKKRELIKQRANGRCEDCLTKTNMLDVHHCYYLYGYEPWEYPIDSLRGLCKSCHVSRDVVEKKHRGLLGELTQEEIKILNNIFSNGWYPKKELFDLIQSIGYDTESMRASFDKLISKKTQIS